jgi:hypothetical protein
VTGKCLLLLVYLFLVSSCVKKSKFEKLTSEKNSIQQTLNKEQENVRIKNSEVKALVSKHTEGKYDIYLSYPDNYKSSGSLYPVLVVLDAEVNFGAVTYIVQRLVKDKLIPEMFVVGIAYKGETNEEDYYSLRSRDFTPSTDKEQEQRHKDTFKFGTGGAENFVKFLSLELFPFLKNNYPIADKDKTIYGHSFGGLFGMHALINQPDLFDNYLLLSPSLWWNQSKILKDFESNPVIASRQLKLYMATGSMEDNMVNDHLEMAGILERVDSNKLKLKSEILENETHRTIFGRGFTNGLRFLYQTK